MVKISHIATVYKKKNEILKVYFNFDTGSSVFHNTLISAVFTDLVLFSVCVLEPTCFIFWLT